MHVSTVNVENTLVDIHLANGTNVAFSSWGGGFDRP